jgi:SAM-dependent methyltransferase
MGNLLLPSTARLERLRIHYPSVIASALRAGIERICPRLHLLGLREVLRFGVAHSRLLFGCAVFLAAFLLFLVEPIAAKQLLPFLGGSAAVWITCLVFFQTALLLAYLYAHWFARQSSSNLGWGLHFLLLAAALALAAFWAFGGIDLSAGPAHPVLTIFFALSVWIGLPFLALGSTSPLLQVWWSRLQLSRFQGTAIPWRLFALSNLASLLALAAYPTLIEPRLTLHAQRIAWCCGFALYACVAALLAHRARSAASESPAPDKVADNDSRPRSSLVLKLLWLFLPMGASMQLCAVTAYITANIAPIPLLWILPLAVYLLTLIFAFEFPRFIPRAIVLRFLALVLASLGYMLSEVDHTWPLRLWIVLVLFGLFIACLFCHVEAYALKPARASESTLFYLLFAAGGALGSYAVGIAFPLLFSFNYDLAITFVVTALLALAVVWLGGVKPSTPLEPARSPLLRVVQTVPLFLAAWAARLVWCAAVVMLLLLTCWLHIAYHRGTLVAVRNFYAALRVKQSFGYPGSLVRTLSNGTIEHGTQIYATDELRRTPTTYYALDSGVGLALRFCCLHPGGSVDEIGNGSIRPRSIGVIGLGAGTLAAYGRKGDHITFYEINPAVIPIARNVFTYIRDSAAQIDIVEGDARTSLNREPPQHFDVLVVDAFSGDAIPLHLLTAQALALYRRHLAPGGILAFHISNQHVDLEPAIALLAQSAGMQALRVSSAPNGDLGEYSAKWVLVADNPAFFAQPEVPSAGRPAAFLPGLRLWTDDYSSLLPLLRW